MSDGAAADVKTALLCCVGIYGRQTMKKALIGIYLTLFCALPALADDGQQLVGVWKLVSYETEFQDGSPHRPMYGQHPTGYIIFTAEGRMAAIIEGEGRKAAKTDEERAVLLRTMFAYTGRYRLEGNMWTTKVDATWNPAWDGTDQVRYFALEGDHLEVTSMWQSSPNLPNAPVTRGILLWEREK